MSSSQNTKIQITDDYKQQYDFVTSDAFATAFVAGKGSGKTWGGALKSLVYCLANPGAWGIITAPQTRILDFATIPKYQKVFPPELIKRQRYSPHPVWDLKNGCKLLFWSTDKPETISGGEIAFAHMDEAALSPYLAYRNILSRMRQKGFDNTSYPYQLWISTTAKFGINWLYNEFVLRPKANYKLIQASTRDNIYLDEVEKYIERLNVSGEQAQLDVEGQFITSAGGALFSPESLSRALENDCHDPLEIEHHGLVSIWKPPVFGVRYMAGADCADEGREGVNCCVIMEQTGEEVAEIYGDISANRFAELIYEVGKQYFFPILGIERNHTAGGVVVTKLQDVDYPNLYYDSKNKPGWYTSVGNRYPALIEYKEAVEHHQTVIRNSDAVGEMSTFVRNAKDKYEHLPEHKDDRVFARTICWQMRGEGPQSREIGCHSFEYRESI